MSYMAADKRRVKDINREIETKLKPKLWLILEQSNHLMCLSIIVYLYFEFLSCTLHVYFGTKF